MKNQGHYNTDTFHLSGSRNQMALSHDKEIILVEFWGILEEFWLKNNI